MAFKHPNARLRAASRHPAGTTPSGVVHVTVRHHTHYVVVGNHLAQHPTLSATAIGLGVHIQSLPTGARVGIKVLADRFPEGEVRIAAALRELEAAGYLERVRVRTPEGRLVTRTVFYNQPRGTTPEPPDSPPPPPARAPDPVPAPQATPQPMPMPAPEPVAAPERASAPVPVAPPVPAPPEAPAPPVPVTPPEAPARQDAVDLLARLRADDPRLLLAERDVRLLAPGVSTWLDRGADPEAVRHVLAGNLPADMRSPAAVIGYRLRAGIPPQMPKAPPPAAHARRPDPLQNCDGCDHAFRAPAPGRCRDCPPEDQAPAVA